MLQVYSGSFFRFHFICVLAMVVQSFLKPKPKISRFAIQQQQQPEPEELQQHLLSRMPMTKLQAKMDYLKKSEPSHFLHLSSSFWFVCFCFQFLFLFFPAKRLCRVFFSESTWRHPSGIYIYIWQLETHEPMFYHRVWGWNWKSWNWKIWNRKNKLESQHPTPQSLRLK